MTLHLWAQRWGVSAAAMAELRALFTAVPTDPESSTAPLGSEAAVQVAVRLEASRKGLRLWRNNVGATVDERGNHIRYGLANDSKAMNESIKSSDLVGVRPPYGQLVVREIKKPGWKYTGTKREQAQLRFLELVASLGGDACFATGPGTL